MKTMFLNIQQDFDLEIKENEKLMEELSSIYYANSEPTLIAHFQLVQLRPLFIGDGQNFDWLLGANFFGLRISCEELHPKPVSFFNFNVVHECLQRGKSASSPAGPNTASQEINAVRMRLSAVNGDTTTPYVVVAKKDLGIRVDALKTLKTVQRLRLYLKWSRWILISN